ncbi:hypothetical protein GO755_16410 [Spirosoma sp. HMF4905]|uniref:T9SS type A sorting domain-containing protein n=1 Tax=Spirosoma arboris TaxID=2682092 RepID=A0A7K1SCY3_9BACT|nr:hypothetical protein [Spirosoma arboris]MVM31631.1 hypothetical protein [Spirosoma arboris]
MKTVYLIISIALCLPALAQSKVALRMGFNAEQNRYEVFAQPNFSAKNFIWGPSQISVVLPANQSKDRLSIRSTSAGTWSDNSVVNHPQADPNSLFHGITGSGGKLDMIAGNEYLLFDFTLPSGYVENVRLFRNGIDPNSAQPGMNGGDFSNYMSDQNGVDYLAVDSRPVVLSVRQDDSALSVTDEGTKVQLIAYPNPAPAGSFRLYLKGFSPNETVTVVLYTLTGMEQKRLTDKVINLSGRQMSVPATDAAYWLLSLERPTANQRFVQRIWVKD